MGKYHERTFPGESAEYRQARDELLAAEIELRAQVEKVAALRRQLPVGGAADNHVFEVWSPTGRTETMGLHDLFEDGKDSLLLYSLMFGPDWDAPCPMCTSFLDGLNGAAPHVVQRTNLAVVCQAPAERAQRWADVRGWDNLRLLSSANNNFNSIFHTTYKGEWSDQHPLMHVFTRQTGQVHHFWTSEMYWARVDGHPRHVDMMWPLWNLFDLLPEGRGDDWYPRLNY